jgi:hypothetical protein
MAGVGGGRRQRRHGRRRSSSGRETMRAGWMGAVRLRGARGSAGLSPGFLAGESAGKASQRCSARLLTAMLSTQRKKLARRCSSGELTMTSSGCHAAWPREDWWWAHLGLGNRGSFFFFFLLLPLLFFFSFLLSFFVLFSHG